jgi:hydroxyethylthiazole kinase-like uncharacterized protein yjeF
MSPEDKWNHKEPYKMLTKTYIQSLIKQRPKDSSKGDYGHALIIAGNQAAMGSAVIASRACFRSGVGLLTLKIPKEERFILQTSIPEAMLIFGEEVKTDYNFFNAIGIGPGIGVNPASKEVLSEILINGKKPLLLDADALNIISKNNDLIHKIPHNTILTPHSKEFDRLFGIHKNTNERIEKAFRKAKEHNIIIVLKGNKTFITNGIDGFFNTTGNAGLAKAGSGDALSGIITSFLAQNYDPYTAAKISVFIHGLAADIAVEKQSMESVLITDIIESLGEAFKQIQAPFGH